MEADKERIIPITILSSQHHHQHKSDENDNKGLSRSAANNNNDQRPKRQSLVVTLEDGTVTETLGILEKQESSDQGNSSLSIQELEQPVVRMVPIKLETEGKMIQKEPEESMQTQAQFTNFTHQEFSDDKRKFFAKYAFMRMATKNFFLLGEKCKMFLFYFLVSKNWIFKKEKK